MNRLRQTTYGFVLAAASAVAVGLVPGAAEGSPLLNGAGVHPIQSHSPNLTVGYAFSIGPTPLTVISLGVYDLDSDGTVGNGLFEAHAVGLWTAGGTVLASVTVPAGTGATLSNGFRFVALGSPVSLLAGQTYVLGAHYTTETPTGDTFRQDNQLSGSDPPQSLFAPGTTWVDGRIVSGLTMPTSNFYGFIGPNLEFASVPEPGTLLMMGAGLVAAAAMRRRRR
jgi:hypothetical protein